VQRPFTDSAGRKSLLGRLAHAPRSIIRQVSVAVPDWPVRGRVGRGRPQMTAGEAVHKAHQTVGNEQPGEEEVLPPPGREMLVTRQGQPGGKAARPNLPSGAG
jgi:hypothetical protein